MENVLLNTYLSDLITKYNIQIITIQELTNPTISDEVIALALQKAEIAICKYTGWDAIDIKYYSALISLAISYLNNDKLTYSSASGERVTKSITQGARAETYESAYAIFDNNGLTAEVKAMLPYPRLRCV